MPEADGAEADGGLLKAEAETLGGLAGVLKADRGLEGDRGMMAEGGFVGEAERSLPKVD